jgi:hypothetical protein
MLRTIWSALTVLVVLVGMSGCVVHERRDWRDRRYGREQGDRGYGDRRYGDRDYGDRDHRDSDDRYSSDCWREGRDWVCRRR